MVPAVLNTTIAIACALAALASCSKKSDPTSTAGSGAATPTAGEPPPPPKAASAPAMTAELFFAELPTWEIQGLDRGLWISDNGEAFQHECRVELARTMMRQGKVRDAARKDPTSFTCAAKGRYAVCTYAPAAEKSVPDSPASWVFVAEEERPSTTVMIAVLIGRYDWATMAAQIPPKTGCPRPSQDP
jgi:hypothetical protein